MSDICLALLKDSSILTRTRTHTMYSIHSPGKQGAAETSRIQKHPNIWGSYLKLISMTLRLHVNRIMSLTTARINSLVHTLLSWKNCSFPAGWFLPQPVFHTWFLISQEGYRTLFMIHNQYCRSPQPLDVLRWLKIKPEINTKIYYCSDPSSPERKIVTETCLPKWATSGHAMKWNFKYTDKKVDVLCGLRSTWL